jgi:hypothetical protein
MKRQIQKKLTLSKETLRNLSDREMQGAAGGGGTFTGLCCSGGASSCCTDDTCVSCGTCSQYTSCC